MCRVTPSFALPFLVLAAAAASSRADKLVLVAGGGDGQDNVPAIKARLGSPFGIAFDKAGLLYFVEVTGQRVCRIDGLGVLHVIAGSGAKGNDGDSLQAVRASFNGPHSLAVARGGAVYVADTWNNRVRKIDARTGAIAAFAGTGAKGYSGDGGPAVNARFGGVYCVALEPAGKRLYLADLDNRRIRSVDLKTGVATTIAGNGEQGIPDDGALATEAPLVDPRAVAADKDRNVYILEREGNALRVVDARGHIHTVAGTGKRGASGDGASARKATLNGPKHLCIDRDGSVLIADTENHLIRRYRPWDGKIVRVAGTGRKGIAGLGGPPDKAELNQPHGVFIGPKGDLYIADSSNHRILKVERR